MEKIDYVIFGNEEPFSCYKTGLGKCRGIYSKKYPDNDTGIDMYSYLVDLKDNTVFEIFNAIYAKEMDS